MTDTTPTNAPIPATADSSLDSLIGTAANTAVLPEPGEHEIGRAHV